MQATATQTHLDRLRTLNRRNGKRGKTNLRCSPEVSRRQLQFAASFLGIGASRIGEILGVKDPSNGRKWLSKRMNINPGPEYLTRLNHLILIKAQRPYAVDGKAMTMLWGDKLYSLTENRLYALDEKGKDVILPSYWKEVWQKKSE